MAAKNVDVQHWPGSEPPTAAAVEARMQAEGIGFYRWSNGPGDVYEAHDHPYDKIIHVASGAITFGLPDLGNTIPLSAGDRLYLPAGTVHDAFVGPDGVVCFEAHKAAK